MLFRLLRQIGNSDLSGRTVDRRDRAGRAFPDAWPETVQRRRDRAAGREAARRRAGGEAAAVSAASVNQMNQFERRRFLAA